jgi:hypothetical protein
VHEDASFCENAAAIPRRSDTSFSRVSTLFPRTRT